MDATWDPSDVKAFLQRLGSSESKVVLLAAHKLQDWSSDPSWTDQFIKLGGLDVLRRVIMERSGNAAAYALQSLTRILELDKGWAIFENDAAAEFIERIVEIVVREERANVTRSAMSVCVAVLSHPSSMRKGANRGPSYFGLRALKPAIAVLPVFLEVVAGHLRADDHATCGNALLLLNAMMRDALTPDEDDQMGLSKSSGTGEEWPTFVKRLWDMGITTTCYKIMHSAGALDNADALLECQKITKYILKKWASLEIDLQKPEHADAFMQYVSAARDATKPRTSAFEDDGIVGVAAKDMDLYLVGFLNEKPADEFSKMGFLGLRDLATYAAQNGDSLAKHLQEQQHLPPASRCPIASVSLEITRLLFEHYQCADPKADDRGKENRQSDHTANGEGRFSTHRLLRPGLMMWPRLHTAGVNAFVKIWNETGAKVHEFDKVSDLTAVLIKEVVGKKERRSLIDKIERDMAHFPCAKLRKVQMDLLDIQVEANWSDQLEEIKDTLTAEAISFLQEQRIRSCTEGAWFDLPPYFDEKKQREGKNRFRFVILSPSRRYLHYDDFSAKPQDEKPRINKLSKKVDVQILSSVKAIHVTPPPPPTATTAYESHHSSMSRDSMDSESTVRATIVEVIRKDTQRASDAQNEKREEAEKYPFSHISLCTLTDDLNPSIRLASEREILTLHHNDQTVIAEWLDGLLALRGSRMLTWQSDQMINTVVKSGLDLRMATLRMEGLQVEEVEGEVRIMSPPVPSRRGLNRNYYYADTSEDADLDVDTSLVV